MPSKKKSRIMRHCPIHLLPPPSLPWIGQRNIGHKNLDFNPLPRVNWTWSSFSRGKPIIIYQSSFGGIF